MLPAAKTSSSLSLSTTTTTTDILAGLTPGELRCHIESHTGLECRACRLHASTRRRVSLGDRG
mgnify:CR=1 FL=1